MLCAPGSPALWQRLYTETVERRRAVRYPIAWPVVLESGAGRSCDVSASGVCFESDRGPACGARIGFALILPDRPDGGGQLACKGEVVRAERRGERWRIAVKLEAIHFEA